MHLLIHLIFYALRQAGKERATRVIRPTRQEIARQNAVTEELIRQVEVARAQKLARTGSPARRKRDVPPQVPTAKPPAEAPRPRTTVTQLRMPLLLGEILGPPVAFCEPEK